MRSNGGGGDAAAVPVVGRALWTLAGLAVVMVVPSRLYLGLRPTTLSAGDVPLVLAMGLGYLLALSLTLQGSGGASRWRAVWTGPAGFALAYGLLTLGPPVPASRMVVLLSALLGTGLLLVRPAAGTGWTVRTAGAAGIVVLSSLGGVPPSGSTNVPEAVAEVETHLSGLHGLKVTSFAMPVVGGRTGGGLVRAGPLLLMVGGSGALVVWDPGAPQRWRRIDAPPPMEVASMEAATGRSDLARRMRVMDVAVRPDPGGWEIFVSHHVFRPTDSCYAVRVSRIPVDEEWTAALPGRVWDPVFEARPCLPYRPEEGREPFFRGNDSGGRLAWLGPDELLLTVGHHMIPGVAQDPDSDYGKTIRIDLSLPAPAARHFSTGHRNPQGLFVGDGTIWETEHGPQGGDELNRLVEGGNYGWDRTSLGTDYGSLEFEPPSGEGGRVASARDPVYAWVPSLAVSDVAVVEGRGFHRWRGDLLVASLKAGELRRLRLADGRVVYDEPIPLGRRIRALVEDGRGAFWLKTDGPELLRLEVDDTGAVEWSACTRCHRLVEDPTRTGPHLGRIFGRPVAAVPEFEYSSALEALGGSWTRDRLDAFLTDPQAFAPGTTMEMDPIADPAVRRRILDHLAKVDRRRPPGSPQP